MVALTPRFLLLAALCAAAAAPSMHFTADARAVDLEARHHEASSFTSTGSTPATFNDKAASDSNAAPPVIPAPGGSKGAVADAKTEGKKHKKGRKGRKDEKRVSIIHFIPRFLLSEVIN